MFTKVRRGGILGLALAALLLGLSGCGAQYPSINAGVGDVPESVQIAIHLVLPQGGNPVVTLTNPSRVLHLYNTVLQLPYRRKTRYAQPIWGPVIRYLPAPGKSHADSQRRALWMRTRFDPGGGAGAAGEARLLVRARSGHLSGRSGSSPNQLAILHRTELDQLPETALLTSARPWKICIRPS